MRRDGAGVGCWVWSVGHRTYSISFFLFGCMMTAAMLVHCFFYQTDPTTPAGLVREAPVLFAVAVGRAWFAWYAHGATKASGLTVPGWTDYGSD